MNTSTIAVTALSSVGGVSGILAAIKWFAEWRQKKVMAREKSSERVELANVTGRHKTAQTEVTVFPQVMQQLQEAYKSRIDMLEQREKERFLREEERGRRELALEHQLQEALSSLQSALEENKLTQRENTTMADWMSKVEETYQEQQKKLEAQQRELEELRSTRVPTTRRTPVKP